MTCDKCEDGFIPFVKDGRVIPNVQLFCECHADHNYEPQVRPDHFDFPISADTHRGLCRLHGWPEPEDDRPPEPAQVEHVHRHVYYQKPIQKQETPRYKIYLNE